MTEKRDPKELDQALAEATDALMAGREPEQSAVPEEMTATVRRLAETMAPEAPPERLRQRIRREIKAEWDAAHAPWWAGLAEMWDTLRRGLVRRPAWSAMAALIVVGLLVMLAVPGVGSVPGTVTGPAAGFWWGLLAGALVALAVIWWRWRR